MFNNIISKRTPALMALLMLAVALLVVSTNSAYATHNGGGLLFQDDFGRPPASNDVDNVEGWTEVEDQDDYCAIKNYQGDMYLQLSNGCDVYLTFEMHEATSLIVEYDWGQHTTGKAFDDGDLMVFLTGNDSELGVTELIDSQIFQPQVKIGPVNNVTVEFDLVSLGLQAQSTTTIQIHFKGTSSGKNDWALVDNINIYNGSDYLPDDTFSYSQGSYGNEAEQVTCDILTAMEANRTERGNDLQEIRDILVALPGVEPGDIDTDGELCLFLVGTIGNGGGSNDGGFLPAGKVDGYANNNLAAQKITLLLNLNLDVILTGDDIPIELYYFLNIDPVLDYVAGAPTRWYDPILTTFGDESLGTCTDSEPDFKCDDGTVVRTELGDLVLALDVAETTVQHMEDAAFYLLMHPADTTILVNGETITRIDMAKLLSLINKSYDVGVPTAFVIYPNNN